jgi:hypothetical protein
VLARAVGRQLDAGRITIGILVVKHGWMQIRSTTIESSVATGVGTNRLAIVIRPATGRAPYG